MHAIDFLNSDVLDLPKTRDDADIQRYVAHILDAYLLELGRVQPIDSVSRNIRSKYGLAETVIADLKTCLQQGIEKDSEGAYQTLVDAISKLGAHFNQFFPSTDISRELRFLYRMAYVAEGPVGKERLFHCPFDKRQAIQPQRYSVGGLPCLYFGGSSYLCWKEIREPDKDRVFISRFEVAPNIALRVVNLAYRPALMAAMVNSNLDEVNREEGLGALAISYAACWPLMAVCAIRRPEDDSDAFEYIVPQLLLRWVVATRQYDGIRFFSTRITDFFDDPKTSANYVFPAKTNPSSGYCTELARMFKLTDPIRWPDAVAGMPQMLATSIRYKERGNPIADLETEFGRAESVLDDLPTARVI